MKIFATLIAVLACLVLAGCAAADETETNDEPEQPATYEVVDQQVTETDNGNEYTLEVSVEPGADLESSFADVVENEATEEGAWYITVTCSARPRTTLVTGRYANGSGWPEAVTGLADGDFEGSPTGERCRARG